MEKETMSVNTGGKNKMEKETMSVIALVLAAVALVGVIGIGAYGYINPTPEFEAVDVSGITINSLAVNALGDDIEDLKDEVKDISVLDINKDDLEDLEDYANWFDNIEKNADDIDDLETWKETGPITGADGADGADGFLNEDEYNCLVNSTNYTAFKGCIALYY